MICATLWARWPVSPTAESGSWPAHGYVALLPWVGPAACRRTPKPSANGFEKSEHPIAAGWAALGSPVGAMLAPPIIYFARLLHRQGGVYVRRWRYCGVVLWWAFYQQTPEKHPNLSKSELEYIKRITKPLAGKAASFFTALKTVSKNKRFWDRHSRLYGRNPHGRYYEFLVPYLPGEEHGMDLKQIAMFAWLPFLACRSRQRGQRLPHRLCSLVRLCASELVQSPTR